MSVRSIELADYDEWLQLRIALWPDCPPDEQRREMAEILEDPQREAVFVSVAPEGHLQGFLEASLRRDYVEGCTTRPVGYIEGWYVKPERRREGIGSALVAAAEEWARAHGCREMASDAEIENPASQSAHKRLGYEETERLVCFRKSL